MSYRYFLALLKRVQAGRNQRAPWPKPRPGARPAGFEKHSGFRTQCWTERIFPNRFLEGLGALLGY